MCVRTAMLLLPSLPLPVRRCLFGEVIMLKLSFILSSPSMLSWDVSYRIFTPHKMGTTPADVVKQIEVLGDGHWPLSDREATQIIPQEYHKNRQGDLAVISSVCQMSEFT